MKISIIDYGLSNLLSVQHAFAHLGAQPQLINTPQQVLEAQALVLPGVGAFRDGMAGLDRLGLTQAIRQKAGEGTPLLGICLGMQMLFDSSQEFGTYQGLGLIPGQVAELPHTTRDGAPQKVPHISWNPLLPPEGAQGFATPLLAGVKPGEECYFIHSYQAQVKDPAHLLAVTQYGGWPVCAVAGKENVLGCQFHPEKSGPVGLAILKGYLDLCAK